MTKSTGSFGDSFCPWPHTSTSLHMQPWPSGCQLLHSGVGGCCCCFWKGCRGGRRGLLLAAPSIFPSLTAFWPWFPTSHPLKALGTNTVWIEGLNIVCAMIILSRSTKFSLNSNQSTWRYKQFQLYRAKGSPQPSCSGSKNWVSGENLMGNKT